jgi:spore coat-associated protein N
MSTSAEPSRPVETRKKLVLSALLLVLALTIVGLGAFASFTSSSSASQTVTTGTVTIALGATGAQTNRLTVNATGLAPSDSIHRSFDLSNTGSLNLASITLTTNATTSSLLDTDATNGLQMAIDRCSTAWTESGSSPSFSYSCSGSTSTVLASRSLIGSNISLSNLGALTSGATDHLRLTITLPSAADNTFQNQSSVIQYTFTGTH